jgi:hypothetical protein
MSLMRWLAAGRSLQSVEDRPSPYRMTQQNLLPRFGQKVAPSVERGAGFLRGVALQAWHCARTWVVEPWKPVARTIAEKWRLRPWKNPFQPRRRTEVVQAELLLESVRVVRNDLSDMDFESQQASDREVAGAAARTGRSWGRITSRIFGSGQGVR